MSKIPVLYIVYNKINFVPKSFMPIIKYQPEKLYISSDGPKKNESSIKIDRVRKYINKNINWKTKSFWKVNKSNLGCRSAVIEAIDWFFENEDFGIIIEEDCIVSQNLFNFCKQVRS